MTRTNVFISAGALLAGLLLGMWLLREPTEPLSVEGLARAKQRWRESGIADYALRYRMNRDVYVVTVEDGIVVAAEVNGQRPQTESLGSYSVEGLFELLALELENLTDPSGPFAGRGGSVLARVRFHHRYGYVERYVRSAGGAGRGAAIEVLKFSTQRP